MDRRKGEETWTKQLTYQLRSEILQNVLQVYNFNRKSGKFIDISSDDLTPIVGEDAASLYLSECIKLHQACIMEEQRLRVFQRRVLRRIFGPKRDEVTGCWRKLHNEELHNLYSSPSIIIMMKSRRMRWAGYVARMGRRGMHIAINIKYILFIFTFLTIIYVYGWCGEVVVSESTAVGDTAYNCLWYERSTRFKRLLLMVMLRAQKPIHINCGPLWVCSFDLVVQVQIFI
ncbi:hypothetical protein B7P43_G04894 [Cryptotermes secundus]|uniref:Uncharacterized protein n=1 Tax=Cryptotermes secundus TaxID=105785 RepID=A0A2J7QV19_9NEOP|nr:hypothetical protein B7P43_G04894 [Cryptotermes secundus]